MRGKAVIALGEFEDPLAETLLIEIAEDSEEEPEVRSAAINALGGYHDNRIARRLVELYPRVSNDLREAVVAALQERGRSGSSYASSEGEELADRLDEDTRIAVTQLVRNAEIEAAGADLARPSGLRVGQSVVGELGPEDEPLEDGSFAEPVVFVGEAGQQVTVDLLSDDFDPFLSVAGPKLEIPLMDDDGGGRCNSRIELVLPDSGRYVAVVMSAGRGPASGEFTVRISEEPLPPLRGECVPPRRVETDDV